MRELIDLPERYDEELVNWICDYNIKVLKEHQKYLNALHFVNILGTIAIGIGIIAFCLMFIRWWI